MWESWEKQYQKVIALFSPLNQSCWPVLAAVYCDLSIAFCLKCSWKKYFRNRHVPLVNWQWWWPLSGKIHFSVLLSYSLQHSPSTKASFHFRVNCIALLCRWDLHFSGFSKLCLSQLFKNGGYVGRSTLIKNSRIKLIRQVRVFPFFWERERLHLSLLPIQSYLEVFPDNILGKYI